MSDLYLSVTIIGILVVFAVLFGLFIERFTDKQEENRIVDEIAKEVLSNKLSIFHVKERLLGALLRSAEVIESLKISVYKKVFESLAPFHIESKIKFRFREYFDLNSYFKKYPTIYLVGDVLVTASEDFSTIALVGSLSDYEEEVVQYCKDSEELNSDPLVRDEGSLIYRLFLAKSTKERASIVVDARLKEGHKFIVGRHLAEKEKNQVDPDESWVSIVLRKEYEKMAQIVEDSNKEAQNPHTHPNPTLEHTYSVEVRKKESPKKPSKKSKVAKNTTKKKVSKAPPKKTKTLSKKSASKKVTKKTSK